MRKLADAFAPLCARLVLLAALLLAGCAPATTGPASLDATPLPTATPEMSRDFTLSTLDGETLTLSDLRGEWVVLNFWATWCAPCVEEMPYLNQVAAERDVRVLGVNFNEDAAVVAPFVADHAISFPILMQPDDITLLVYGVRGLPRTTVIAPDGTIAHTIIGQIDPITFDAWLDAHQVPLR
jgi:thiol-disulfide isomerase/thioredoxin